MNNLGVTVFHIVKYPGAQYIAMCEDCTKQGFPHGVPKDGSVRAVDTDDGVTCEYKGHGGDPYDGYRENSYGEQDHE